MDLVPAGGRLLALHDATFTMRDAGSSPRNLLRLWDPAAQVCAETPTRRRVQGPLYLSQCRSQQPTVRGALAGASAPCETVATSQAEVAASHDFMESYELVCFVCPDQDAGGNEVIAGAVHGGALCLHGPCDCV